MDVDKVLVTGVDGLVGANVAAVLAERCEVLGIAGQAEGPEGCRMVPCDPYSADDLARAIASESPRQIIHCGPLSRPNWDMAEIAAPDAEGEVGLATAVVSAAQRVGARSAILLTDAVFAGPRLFHNEASPPQATTPWAEAARAVENALIDCNTLLVRTHAYGWSPPGASANYAQQMWQRLSQGEPCEVDAERHATPILASDLATLVHLALQKKLTGLMHLTGAERTSPFRFAAELALACGFAGRHVRVAKDVAPRRPRVDETSLNTYRARRELETPLPLLREGLARFAEQAENGFRDRLDPRSRLLHSYAA
ncbi:MAG TPA: sugar nucleotide-binding protein [Pirellulales bacterium]|nr:sugar nucleotide-binding protein [Pirellulales bacterium]